MTALRFTVDATDGHARAGRVQTTHSVIETPVFMPIGTAGVVKALTTTQLEELGPAIILGNSYHLYLRPGLEVLRGLGGMHGMMDWKQSILTDSGGFQAFSLAKLRKLGDDSIEFQSHIDGSRHVFTPEKVMEIQAAIGSDIAMCLDDCPALPATPERLDDALARTTRWSARCLAYPRPAHQALFGIVQGGLDVERRLAHLAEMVGLGFDGYALGGLSVGETPEEMVATCAAVVPQMPADRPRYLMGVGTPRDLVECVAQGIDMFDCVLPTRNARMGTLYTWQGRLNIKRAENRSDERPIDESCGCPTCARYSRAYLRHLFVAREITGLTLLTQHNVWFYLDLMRRVRAAIRCGRFEALRQAVLSERFPEDDDAALTA